MKNRSNLISLSIIKHRASSIIQYLCKDFEKIKLSINYMPSSYKKKILSFHDS
ncbi:unnamed protein product, partial [marine sediment metagenome]